MRSVDLEPNEEEKQQKLSGDFSRPFSPPAGTKDTITKDDQALETGIDEHEWYDEGRDGAAEKIDLKDRGIRGYKPKHSTLSHHGPVRVIKTK